MKIDLFRKINLQFFANGGEEGNDNVPENNGDNSDDKSNGTDNKTPVKKLELTQEELDALIAKRLERERKKFSDYDDLKKKLAEFEKSEEERKRAEMTEIERLQADLQARDVEKQTLEQQLNELRETIKREKIVNEFIKVATAHNIAYIDDALKLADLSAVTVDDNGVKGVEEAVKALVENKPYLVATKKEPKRIGESTNHDDKQPQKTKEQLLAEAAEKARKSGRIEDRMAYAQLKKELGL